MLLAINERALAATHIAAAISYFLCLFVGLVLIQGEKKRVVASVYRFQLLFFFYRILSMLNVLR